MSAERRRQLFDDLDGSGSLRWGDSFVWMLEIRLMFFFFGYPIPNQCLDVQNLDKNGDFNYQPQLVQDFSHQQYD